MKRSAILNCGTKWKKYGKFHDPAALLLRGEVWWGVVWRRHALGTNWTGKWVSPKAGMDALVKKNPFLRINKKNHTSPPYIGSLAIYFLVKQMRIF
jgi:hypothetical protein